MFKKTDASTGNAEVQESMDLDTGEVTIGTAGKKKSGLWLWIVLGAVAAFILWTGISSDQKKKQGDSGAPIVEAGSESFIPGNKRPDPRFANFAPKQPDPEAAPQVAQNNVNNAADQMSQEEKMLYLRQRSPLLVKDGELDQAAKLSSRIAPNASTEAKDDGFIRDANGAAIGVRDNNRARMQQVSAPAGGSFAAQDGAGAAGAGLFGNSGQSNTSGGRSEDEQFFERSRQTRAIVVRATPPQDMSYRISEGKMISGTLETAISSDLPGRVRAIVDEDIYGEHDRNVLIPRASKLIGQYNHQVRNGQSRLLVVWTRLIRPDGSSIDLGSYGTDGIGRSGVTGDVNNHFLRRFGTAALLSVIGAGISDVRASAGDDDSTGADLYRLEVARSIQQQTNEILKSELQIPPTISVAQGERIRVFVAQDLDFRAVSGSDFEAAGKRSAPFGQLPVSH